MTKLAAGLPFGVHLLTAAGAALGFAALMAAVDGRFTAMFWCLAAAFLVDGIDGSLARRLRVAEALPRWSGDVLDLVVDFVTYVFVPAYAIVASGLLPSSIATAAGVLIVVTSALYFADRRMKTADHFFRGFPALWNAVAFYVFLLRPQPWIVAAAVAVLAVLTFVPIKFLHPFRVRRLRALSLVVLAIWCILAVAALVDDLAPPRWVTVGLVAAGLYFFSVGYLVRWIAKDGPAV